MSIEVKDNARLDSLADDMRDTIAKKLKTLLPDFAQEIVDRTRSGKSIDGDGFAPYSDSYAEAKAAALGSASPVSLTFTGEMLDSIKTKIEGGRSVPIVGTIEITGNFNQEKARWNQGANDAIPSRPFMGLSQEQKDKLFREIQNAIIL